MFTAKELRRIKHLERKIPAKCLTCVEPPDECYVGVCDGMNSILSELHRIEEAALRRLRS